jgi:hypothetical protein
VIARGTAEVGMHLHAWNSPPTEPLTADDWRGISLILLNTAMP